MITWGASPVVAEPAIEAFEIAFLADGGEVREALVRVDPARVEFVAPVRRFGSHRGQRHFPGLWWSSTVGKHVGYESWLERDQLILLDFDPMVVSVTSQPFRLSWQGERGRRSHVPDFFARCADGSGRVVDCRPDDRIPERDAEAFAATARACALVGWRYERVGGHDRRMVTNVRWLAGYRQTRFYRPPVARAVRERFTAPTALMAGAAAVGDPLGVLPVVFHLLWCGELTADLRVPLHQNTLVTMATAR